MSQPHGSIPGYRHGPILNGPRKAFVASLFILPLGAYVYVQRQQHQAVQEQLRLEQEGRRNWSDDQQDPNAPKNLTVLVNRSGGGV